MQNLFGLRDATTTRAQDASAAKASVMNDPMKPQPPVTRTVPRSASFSPAVAVIGKDVEPMLQFEAVHLNLPRRSDCSCAI
jgi:hypothetical protein